MQVCIVAEYNRQLQHYSIGGKSALPCVHVIDFQGEDRSYPIRNLPQYHRVILSTPHLLHVHTVYSGV